MNIALGGTRILKANIRMIAATNRDLRKAVERDDFREDPYDRASRLTGLRSFYPDVPSACKRASRA